MDFLRALDELGLNQTTEQIQQPDDLSFQDLHHKVCAAIGNLSDRRIRDHLKGLRIVRNERGYYENADAVLIVGWIKRRDNYRGYKDFLNCEGKALYARAQVLV